ncbi:insulin receptor [Elysia marginata]|uniref:Insulin receptor n=1 Tax=Elysia marginata TaxID=1093978 RepID=A0AAV4FYB9_9GAST|nr:insulin receptor [Elysia marginata]
MDNENLEELFLESQVKQMEIKGNASFVGNRHLCQWKIDQFLNSTGLSLQHKDKIESNGQKLPCKVLEINLKVMEIGSKKVNLEMQLLGFTDSREILHYSVHYKEVTEPVKDIYEGRDACSADSWQMQKVKSDGQSNNPIVASIQNLKPFTKYAIYVKAEVVKIAMYAAYSRIYYIMTNIDKPSDPEDLETPHLGTNEMKLVWKPPRAPNSVVTFYIIWLRRSELTTKIDPTKHDLCSNQKYEKLLWDKTRKERLAAEKRKKNLDYQRGCCPCPISKEDYETEQQIRTSLIEMENAIHGQIFKKRWNKDCNKKATQVAEKMATNPEYTGTKSRKRRDADQLEYLHGTNFSRPIRKEDLRKKSEENPTNSLSYSLDSGFNDNSTLTDDASLVEEFNKKLNETLQNQEEPTMVVFQQTSARLTSLEHYSFYTIEKVEKCPVRRWRNALLEGGETPC